jgi:hypothetical protein
MGHLAELLKKYSGIMNSLHRSRNVNTPTVIHAGFSRGTMIDQKS